jgi:hypothetical protein
MCDWILAHICYAFGFAPKTDCDNNDIAYSQNINTHIWKTWLAVKPFFVTIFAICICNSVLKQIN